MTIDAVPAVPLAEWFQTLVPGVADGPVDGHADLRRALQPHLPDHRRGRLGWALRRPPTGDGAGHGARHEPRVALHHRARPDARAGAPSPSPTAPTPTSSARSSTSWASSTAMVLGDEESGRRLAPDARRAARSRRRSTSSRTCTPSTRTRSGWRTCAAPAATWSASCAAGTGRCTSRRSGPRRRRRRARPPRRSAPPSCRRRTCGSPTATTGWATSPSAPTAPCAPSSTGSWRRSATRWPTSAG